MFTALDWPGFAELSIAGVLFLCAAAFLAGAVDAIAGGGGLIQLPATLLLMPGQAIFALGTSKVASLAGTLTAARTYATRTPIHWPSALAMTAVALAGSFVGAFMADLLPSWLLNIIVLVAVVLVGLYTWLKPEIGSVHAPRFGPRRRLTLMLLGGLLLGFWDGIAGPGTGSFLVFLLVGLIGYAFLPASAVAKLVNVGTNVGALVFFIPTGKVIWGAAILMALSNMAGSAIGASTAVRHGSGFVRRVFLTVVVALVVSLGWRLVAGT